MKGGLILSISVSLAALLVSSAILLVALAGVRALDSMAEHYMTQSEVARKDQASKEDLSSVALEAVGFACAKVLGKFKMISPEDEQKIASAAASRVKGKSDTIRSLIEAVERYRPRKDE